MNANAPSTQPPASDAANGKAAQDARLPLFYKKPVPLDASKHAKAGLSKTGNYAFTRDVNSIPANIGEFALLAKFYPIIFVGGDVPMPIAVIGLDQRNLMIDSQGQWLGDVYIPAYVRRYPFVLITTQEQDKFFLAVDEQAETFKADQADRPFYEEDKTTQLVENAMKFCQAFQNDHEMTGAFVKVLKELDLLTTNSVTVTLADGETKRAMAGFKTINQEKLHDLTDEQFLRLRKEGWLPFIYAQMFSLDNWPRLGSYAERNKIVLTKEAPKGAG